MTSYTTVTHHRRTASLPFVDDGPSRGGKDDSFVFKVAAQQPSQIPPMAGRTPVDDYWSKKSMTTARSGEIISGGTLRKPSDKLPPNGKENYFSQSVTSTMYPTRNTEYKFSTTKTTSSSASSGRPLHTSSSFSSRGNHFDSGAGKFRSTSPGRHLGIRYSDDGDLTSWEESFKKFDFSPSPSEKFVTTDEWKKQYVYKPAEETSSSRSYSTRRNAPGSSGGRVRESGPTSRNVGIQRGYVSDSEESWNWLEEQKGKLAMKRAMQHVSREKLYVDDKLSQQRAEVEGKLLNELRSPQSTLTRRAPASSSDLRYRARSVDNLGVNPDEYDVSYTRYGATLQRKTSTPNNRNGGSLPRVGLPGGRFESPSPQGFTLGVNRRLYQTLPRNSRPMEMGSAAGQRFQSRTGASSTLNRSYDDTLIVTGGSDRHKVSTSSLLHTKPRDQSEEEEIVLQPIGRGVQPLESNLNPGATLTRLNYQSPHNTGGAPSGSTRLRSSASTSFRSGGPENLESLRRVGVPSTGTGVGSTQRNGPEIRDDEIVVEQAIHPSRDHSFDALPGVPSRSTDDGIYDLLANNQGHLGSRQPGKTITPSKDQPQFLPHQQPQQQPSKVGPQLQQQEWSTVRVVNVDRSGPNGHSTVKVEPINRQVMPGMPSSQRMQAEQHHFTIEANRGVADAGGIQRDNRMGRDTAAVPYQQQLLIEQQQQIEQQILQQQKQLEMQQNQLLEQQQQLQRQLEQHRFRQQQMTSNGDQALQQQLSFHTGDQKQLLQTQSRQPINTQQQQLTNGQPLVREQQYFFQQSSQSLPVQQLNSNQSQQQQQQQKQQSQAVVLEFQRQQQVQQQPIQMQHQTNQVQHQPIQMQHQTNQMQRQPIQMQSQPNQMQQGFTLNRSQVSENHGFRSIAQDSPSQQPNVQSTVSGFSTYNNQQQQQDAASQFNSPFSFFQKPDPDTAPPFSPTGASRGGNPQACTFEMVTPTFGEKVQSSSRSTFASNSTSGSGVFSPQSQNVLEKSPRAEDLLSNGTSYSGRVGISPSQDQRYYFQQKVQTSTGYPSNRLESSMPQNFADQRKEVQSFSSDDSALGGGRMISPESYLIQQRGVAGGMAAFGNSINNQSTVTGVHFLDSPERTSRKNDSAASSIEGSLTPLSIDVNRTRWMDGHGQQSSPSLLADRSSGESMSSRDGAMEPPGQISMKFVKDSSHLWYKPQLTREEVIIALKNRPVGSFLVRDSNTYPGSYALAVKVATIPENAPIKKNHEDPSEELVRHFLIEPTPTGVRLKGYKNESVFGSLGALIYQHSITPLSLPCRLLLPALENYAREPYRATDISPSTADPLSPSAAFNVLYILSVPMELLSGPEALDRTTTLALDKAPTVKTTVVSLKISPGGVTITDNSRTLFFRQHFPTEFIRYCGLDRRLRCWTYLNQQTGQIMKNKIFGIISRRSGISIENECHLFAELDPNQPCCNAILNSINQIVQERDRK